MIKIDVRRIVVVALASGAVAFVGCSSAQKQTPHMGVGGFSIETRFERDDLVVMDSVEGTSSTVSILLGLLQIIDDDKVKILYIPFFKDKFTYFATGPLGRLFVTPEDRAYYKALEKAPDADVVFMKAMDRESTGIPLLFSDKTVTWRGKSMKFKADR